MSPRERFGPYEVHEQIGVGGMATVHRATLEVGSGVYRDVALKRMHPELASDKRVVEHLIREAKLASTLQHPNIVRIYELGCIGETYFIAMELVYGVPLLSLMRTAHTTKRPPPIAITLALLGELCDALDYASNGTDMYGEPLRIVHRDLSPTNLLVTDEGHLKLIDFGVAKALAGTRFQTSSGQLKGKLAYMSIEALDHGPIDGRADVFSAGVIAWEMLCARRLFKGKTDDAIIASVRGRKIPPPSRVNPDCPPEVDDIVLRALARDVEQRWPTAAAMRDALEKVRRRLRGRSSARDIAAWVDAVPGRQRMSVTYAEETDELRLSTADIVSAEYGALEEIVLDPSLAIDDTEKSIKVDEEAISRHRARTAPGVGTPRKRR